MGGVLITKWQKIKTLIPTCQHEYLFQRKSILIKEFIEGASLHISRIPNNKKIHTKNNIIDIKSRMRQKQRSKSIPPERRKSVQETEERREREEREEREREVGN